ncbi:sce7726 family protein [Pseudomonas aeruginosa]|nr:sce7726 family protein [Pseudomonas aeruginosa]EIU2716252.1 sce7726 family protein [Pseudomonas aeruginosa]EIU2863071.1 sce7726 family protein [Pseudomonas aeruginosa]ELD5772959.1 sce7726 family protein [Pseudomonas aeruginosa]MBG4606966.1 sce7726 family protein [Pseudomonas aeruginosa]MBG5780285.1 sce7726 family protein [Pseudomonas aeruginosa]
MPALIKSSEGEMREAEIKRALKDQLETEAGGRLPFLEEVQINGGEIRADLVQVQDMHCYEIKSAGDTLNRLIGQGSRYARVFELVTLVLAERHLKKAIPMLPTWWGVVIIPGEAAQDFQHLRRATPNVRQEAETLATLLNRDEALAVLAEIGATRGYRSKSLYQIQNALAEMLPLPELKSQVRQRLLIRCGQAPAELPLFSSM